MPKNKLASTHETDTNSRIASLGDDVIFFDAFCVLCSGTLASLIKIDKNRKLKCSSWQGECAQKHSERPYVSSSTSVFFLIAGATYERFVAVIHILIMLGSFYKLLGSLLNLLPIFVGNVAYNLVAKNRNIFFWKENDSCFIPMEEDRVLFRL